MRQVSSAAVDALNQNFHADVHRNLRGVVLCRAEGKADRFGLLI